MTTIMAYNQKGGVGKTALIVNLAYHHAGKGRKVLVFDLDAWGAKFIRESGLDVTEAELK